MMTIKPHPVGLSGAMCIDLTRLYYSIRRLEVRIDYRAMVEVAQRGGPRFDPVLGFTASDPKNEPQARLLDRLRSDGWLIDEHAPRDAALFSSADKLAAEDSFRFDTAIAFALGRLAGEVDRVVLVTDSYPLHVPVDECVRRGTRVDIAYFRDELDPRWRSRIASGQVGFIELGEPNILLGNQEGGGADVGSALSSLR
jgi:hypothetical protein